MVVECEVDDLPGEAFGFLMERLFEAGALDVFFTPVQMKKNRPGTLITLLCRRQQLEPLAGVLLMESGSLGCRYHSAARFEAERETVDVETAFGTVRVNSTCRSHAHNRRVGGARRSFHLTGRAADFRLDGNVAATLAYLRKTSVGGIKHYGSGVFHIDTGPRRTW